MARHRLRNRPPGSTLDLEITSTMTAYGNVEPRLWAGLKL
jgi:hypothetical protein